MRTRRDYIVVGACLAAAAVLAVAGTVAVGASLPPTEPRALELATPLSLDSLSPSPSPSASANPSATSGTHGDGYSRAMFGKAWADVDGNGCDTRNDTLARHLTDVVLAADGCTVLTGVLVDPYTGATVAFTRGARPQPVQIDHVVALHDAWHRGADTWTPERRLAFANDPSNLLPTTLNSSKGDREPAALVDATDKWQPSPEGECRYARRYVLVGAEHLLASPGSADELALGSILQGCPS